MVLIVLLCEMAWSFVSVFVVCEFGQKVCDAFFEIDDEICQLDWYLFSIEIQKILLTLMINTQKPVSLGVFGNITCDREDFKKVRKFANNRNLRMCT